ncbi:MAG: hypothetical protein ACI8V5_002717, partial [Limisphaerales bacterium]
GRDALPRVRDIAFDVHVLVVVAAFGLMKV